MIRARTLALPRLDCSELLNKIGILLITFTAEIAIKPVLRLRDLTAKPRLTAEISIKPTLRFRTGIN